MLLKRGGGTLLWLGGYSMGVAAARLGRRLLLWRRSRRRGLQLWGLAVRMNRVGEGGASGGLPHPGVLLHLRSSLPGLREDGADHALGAPVAGGRVHSTV